MKLSSKQSALIKSYWHAFIAVETAFIIQYIKTYSVGHTHFNLSTFAYSAVGAVAAPLSRILVEKYPWLSPLVLRITTKIAQEEQNITAPTVSVSAPIATSAPEPATPATPPLQVPLAG